MADSYSLRKIPWTKKPPPGTLINFGHPMVEDMIFFCAHDRPGDQVDLIQGQPGLYIEEVPADAFIEMEVDSPFGLCTRSTMVSGNNNNQEAGWKFGAHPEYAPTAVTWMARCFPAIPHDHLNGSYPVAKKATGGGAVNWGGQFQSSSVDQNFIEDFVVRNNGFTDLTLTKSAAGSWHDHWCDVAGAQDTNGRDAYIWSDDDDDQELINQTGGAVATSTEQLMIHGRELEDRVFPGLMNYSVAWKVRKSKEFLEEFRSNPWQIFESKKELLLLTATTVIITDVNGTETWIDGATGLVITGTGFS